jgi:hypothetical protein
MMDIGGFGAAIEPLTGELPTIAFKWDAETEILSGTAADVEPGRGLTGSIELEGKEGSVVTLDFQAGILRGLEVVVWPPVTVVDDLSPPEANRRGRLTAPARASQPGIGVVEVDVSLAAERRPDDSAVRLRVVPARVAETVQVADHLLVELDENGELAGFWLLDVPRFPQEGG